MTQTVNIPCCNKEMDIWTNFEFDEDFKYCPFCGKEIRTGG